MYGNRRPVVILSTAALPSHYNQYVLLLALSQLKLQEKKIVPVAEAICEQVKANQLLYEDVDWLAALEI